MDDADLLESNLEAVAIDWLGSLGWTAASPVRGDAGSTRQRLLSDTRCRSKGGALTIGFKKYVGEAA